MLLLILLPCAWLIHSVHGQSSVQGHKVNTTEGVVVGVKATDGDYIAFYGIPYAGSVSGKRRFKAAPKPDNRSAEFNAVDKDIKCAQPGIKGLVGKEDCLTLNIFTNNLITSKPVIVWLDGEEYSNTVDTPAYSFRSLVQSDIVFIAVNFRLSIFGFLCLGVDDAPGNAGLKDVVQALKWIQENVARFGGDPKNVTLLGHGSGAAMVDLLTMSPLSEGLMQKTVSLSGSALSPWAVAYDPVGYAKALGAKLNLVNLTNAELATRLQNTDTNVLFTAINQFSFTNGSVLFAPCVENPSLEGSFLRDDPLRLIQSGKYHKIPYIASYVNREGTIRVKEAVDGNWLKMMQNDFEAFLPAYLALGNESMRKHVSEELRKGYFGSTEDISVLNSENIQDYIAYQGDILITVPVIRGVKERAARGDRDVRLLEFSFTGINHDWPYENIRLDGANHGDILDYIFDLDSRTVDDNPKKSLTGRIVAYAKTGSPVVRIAWVSYTVENHYYLRISGQAAGTSANSDPTFSEGMELKPHEQSVNLCENIFSGHYAVAQPVTSGVREVAAETADVSSDVPLIIGLLTLSIIIVAGILITVKKTNLLGKLNARFEPIRQWQSND